MIYNISVPSVKSGTIELPSSKSISNRLLLINVLSANVNAPENLSESDDTAVMLKALESDCSLVDVGAAGTSMRFLTAYLSLLPGTHVITGSERMKKRPIGVLVDALRMLGADIEYAENEGFPPLRICGKELRGGTIELPGNISSQYISALMMIAPMIRGGLNIELVGKIVSQPYINMTLQTMKQFGVEGKWSGSHIEIPEGKYLHKKVRVESDWSAASYWYEMSALAGQTPFTMVGLAENSLQGDSEVRNIAKKLGVETSFSEKDGLSMTTVVANASSVKHLDYDFNSQPDIAQTFVVLCCCLGVTFHFTGLESLKIKETDRISALINECRKIGFVLKSNDVDDLAWDGETCEPCSEPIATYKDHRMAMAFAPAALKLGSIRIDDPAVVSKSYPRYWDDLKKVGFVIEEA